jgi:exodeoxyribonuclease VII large subunit
MVVESLEPEGIGALQLAFEQLKKRLAEEGLFDEDRKQELPALPNRVGVVTSETGAALRDILKVLLRLDHLEVVVAPAAVQGEGAGAKIAAALGRLAASGLVNVIIVGRGGGSLEDLWAFNEEVVARAIADCPVPVISGVGHEVDFTIADFVADVRAATPTRAAEFVVAKLEEQQRRVDHAGDMIERDFIRKFELASTRLAGLVGSAGLARVPQRVKLMAARLERADRLRQLFRGLLESFRNRFEQAGAILRRVPARVAAGGHRQVLQSRRQQLSQLMRARVRRSRVAVDASERALGHLSPTMVLERGYSITMLEGERKPLKDAASVAPGQSLKTTLARGELRSVVASGGARKKPKAPAADQPSLFDDGEE